MRSEPCLINRKHPDITVLCGKAETIKVRQSPAAFISIVLKSEGILKFDAFSCFAEIDGTFEGIARLASGLREAGTYALRWDGRDDAGRQMASGVYLYRLEAPAMTGDRIVQMRKLLLLR